MINDSSLAKKYIGYVKQKSLLFYLFKPSFTSAVVYGLCTKMSMLKKFLSCMAITSSSLIPSFFA